MAQSLASYFVDDPAIVVRTAEETNADANWQNGMNAGASNSPGIGISSENPNLEEALFAATNGSGDLVTGSWTLLDQHGAAREAQIGQCLGGLGFSDPSTSSGAEGILPEDVIRFGGNPTAAAKEGDSALDGAVIPLSNSTLSVLADGWIGV
jgi:hypothetical protein